MNTRTITGTAAAVIAAAAVTSCSLASAPGPLTYAPAAYGVAGQCYYVDSPAEAVALQAAGLCPQTWAPTLMPLAWHETYYAYYDSDAYYDTYVPAKVRTVYVRTETTFGKSYHTAITTRSKTATYRSSAGKVVKGAAVTSKTKFGSGKSFGAAGQKNGGGSLRSGSSKTVTSKSGSSGSSSSRSSSSRSGSLRSGSFSGSRSSGSHR